MCVSSNSNIVFPCKICKINNKNKDSAVQCGICQFWIHIKCNKLDHIDYKYIQGSNDPWYCISCCDKIPFGTLTNNNFLSLADSPPDAGLTNNRDAYISINSALSFKPFSDLSLLFNQFNNFFPEHKKRS